MVNGIGKNVYILGIGGISMSAIAEILVNYGHKVSGYDKTISEISNRLKCGGIVVDTLPSKEKIASADCVVYTSAIKPDNDGFIFARELNKPILTRAEALRLISENYNEVIAISGSHGKTTTTAITSTIFDLCEQNVTTHVGGVMVKYNSNVIIKGKGGVFITEACEYEKNFLKLFPTIGVILNLELDHTDVYGSWEDLVDSYIEFSNNIVDGGILIIDIDSVGADRVIKETKRNKRVLTYSATDKDADIKVSNIKKLIGAISFDVIYAGQFLGNFYLPCGGVHNAINASIAIILGVLCGCDKLKIEKAVGGYLGVKRRYEKVGRFNGADVIFDYAHHPTEIESVIKETREFGNYKKVYVVFQSHTYSRTKSFWGEFIKSLSLADQVIMYPIYPAREKPIAGVTAKRMAYEIRRHGTSCYYANNFDEIVSYLNYFIEDGDCVLVLGAGDIDNLRLKLF